MLQVFDGRAAAAQPALVDGIPSAVWAPGGRPRVAFVFRDLIRHIVQADGVIVVEIQIARRGSEPHPDRGATVTDSPASPASPDGVKIVLHPVTDLAKAKEVYSALLGIAPQADGPYYVGYDVAGQHVGLVPGGGPQGMKVPVAYWQVPGHRGEARRGDGRGRRAEPVSA
jgi:hypothetical protein